MRVILESPYGADPCRFVTYARACVSDSLSRGENPFASHLLYTQPGILDDTISEERARGMAAGLAWYEVAEAIVVYRDLGISPGMQIGIDAGVCLGLPIHFRSIRDLSPRSLQACVGAFPPP